VTGLGIVIATCDDGSRLLPTLERLAALPESPPVMVVDNGTEHDLAASVRAAGHRPAEVDVMTLDADHGPAARTLGVRALGTELVALCDDDSWFAPGALAKAAGRFAREPGLALLQARVLVGPDERLDPTCARVENAPALLGFVACGAVLRACALLEVGGFARGRGFGGEEQPVALDLAAAGWRLAYDPDLIAHHHPLPSRRRRGRGRSMMSNDLGTWWSRLPWRLAARRTAEAARRRPAAVLAALPAVASALGDRRPVPPPVVDALRAVERHERLREHGTS
jgi:N-acetylglucosaminyl-diphospho-decaprenol L-rhamnosyltransferase